MKQVACITGVGNPYGQAVSGQLADQGWEIVAIDLDQATPASLHTALPLALGQRRERVRAFVHCAGFPAARQAEQAPLHTLQLDDWDQTLALHLESGLLLAQALAGPMQDACWGRMVFLGSQAARSPLVRHDAAYACAMGGLLGLSRAMALELGPFGITANLVVPDATATSPGQAVPSPGRAGTPADVAALIGFLLTDAASAINGTVQDVNGGQIML